ncbi:MAG: PorT family protein [Bacteroidetes bacterium]|nr:PorT family protein [Bacteroidota bacterium]
MKKTLLFLIAMVAVILSANGQSGFEVNSGFIKPFSILNKDAPYTSGSSADYNLSYYISTAYKIKTSDKLFLGLKLSFNNYKLDFYEKTAIHPGLDEQIKDLAYSFNYLNLFFYPELVFGNELKYYLNAGVFGGIYLNGAKTGLLISGRSQWGPDGPFMEYIETGVEGKASEDVRNFTAGVQLGTGLRYQISDNWGVHLNVSGRFIPFPVENDFTQNQIDLIISVGAEYIIKRREIHKLVQ